MKIYTKILGFLFCILTLGYVDFEAQYNDKTIFKWDSWMEKKYRGVK